MSSIKNYAKINNPGECEDSPQICDKKKMILPNGKQFTELRISSPRFKVNLSHNMELKLLSSSHNKKKMMTDCNSLGRSSVMKEYCEGTIDNKKSNGRLSYSQLMLQTFAKIPHT